jgi:hypothetical protein
MQCGDILLHDVIKEVVGLPERHAVVYLDRQEGHLEAGHLLLMQEKKKKFTSVPAA